MKTTSERSTAAALRYVFLTLLVAAVGCSSAPNGPSESSAEEQSPIILGNGVSGGTATAAGDVKVEHTAPKYDGCSGVLLRNDLVVTARHCVTTDGTIAGTVDTNGADFKLTMDGQIVHGAEIIDATLGGTQFDFAYIVVTPFLKTGPSSNQSYGWSRPVYARADATLNGTTLTCQGYGDNTFTSGYGTLRTASLAVSSSSSTTLTFTPNPSTQIPWLGDSGGTCFTSTGAMTFIQSTCSPSGMTVTSCSGTGPEIIFPNASAQLLTSPGGTTYQSNSGNVAGDSMQISNKDANGNANAGVWVTPNWNPAGQSGAYLNHNLGVWYDGSSWWVFNQDKTPMPTGVSFNVSVGYNSLITGAVSGDSMSLGFGGASNIFIITPMWNPPGGVAVYNDHPTGIWFDGSNWWAYNEDKTSMPAGVTFNVHPCDPNDGAYIHFANSSNTTLNYTILDNPNLNGQPGAKLLVTHNWNPAGATPTYNPHPIGVWYTGSRWAIFNQDLAAMPTTIAFNVLVTP